MDDELRELIKGFLGKLDVEQVYSWPRPRPIGEMEKDVWLKALRWCPKELQDLVNSKACRGDVFPFDPWRVYFRLIRRGSSGAIMFNDPLDLKQCRNLVKQLSETSFPFQCAHGRYVCAIKQFC